MYFMFDVLATYCNPVYSTLGLKIVELNIEFVAFDHNFYVYLSSARTIYNFLSKKNLFKKLLNAQEIRKTEAKKRHELLNTEIIKSADRYFLHEGQRRHYLLLRKLEHNELF